MLMEKVLCKGELEWCVSSQVRLRATKLRTGVGNLVPFIHRKRNEDLPSKR